MLGVCLGKSSLTPQLFTRALASAPFTLPVQSLQTQEVSSEVHVVPNVGQGAVAPPFHPCCLRRAQAISLLGLG